MDGDNKENLEQSGQLSDQVFNDAFNEAAGKEPETKDDKLPEDTELPGDKSEDNKIPDDSTQIPNDAKSPPADPDPNDATYEQRWKTLQGMHKHDKEKWDKERAELLSQLEAGKKTESTPPAPSTPPNPPPEPPKKLSDEEFLKSFMDSLTDEQRKSLSEYDEEFDIVSKMEGLKRDTAMKKLRKEMMEEVNSIRNELSTQLPPIQKFANESIESRKKADEDAHFSAIRTAHPDFETYRDDGSILAWIETKPAYLRRGMAEVYKQGNSEEIVSLISDFKTENNIQSAPEPPHDNSRKQERKNVLNVPVGRKSAVNQSLKVADDFEGAFDEALSR